MTTFDVLKLINTLREEYRDDTTSGQTARRALNNLSLEVKRAFEQGYLGDHYRTDYVVTGRGAFPVDMLRYTVSWPKDEADARAVEDSIESGSNDDQFTVTLSKYHRDPQPQLAADRWASKFRWKVLRVVETVPL